MDPRSALAWDTEWKIASAGSALTRAWGPHALCWDCRWSELPGSHLIHLRREGSAYPDTRGLPPLPCSHAWIAKWPEAPHDHWPHPAEWAMWLEGGPLERLAATVAPSAFRHPGMELEPVESTEDWARLLAFRLESESVLPRFDETKVKLMVEYLQDRSARMRDARWYLARDASTRGIVGGIGRVRFQAPLGPLDRLQDVDILPGRQGEGLGTAMLAALARSSVDTGARALCLRADAQDWPKDWYRKLGFKRVGTWARLEVAPPPAPGAEDQ